VCVRKSITPTTGLNLIPPQEGQEGTGHSNRSQAYVDLAAGTIRSDVCSRSNSPICPLEFAHREKRGTPPTPVGLELRVALGRIDEETGLGDNDNGYLLGLNRRDVYMLALPRQSSGDGETMELDVEKTKKKTLCWEQPTFLVQ
jgi:hypothetical protein